MTEDLLSTPEPIIDPTFSDQPCALCAAATGEYNWGNVCCRARFVAGLPYKDLRRGWIERWRAVESSAFCSAIEQAVKALWEAKMGALNV